MRNKKEKNQVRHLNPTNLFLISTMLFTASGCLNVVKEAKTDINVESQVSKVSVSSVSLNNNQLYINGANLDVIQKVWIKGVPNNDFSIVSRSPNLIVASPLKNFTYVLSAAGEKLVNLVLSDAYGQSVFTVNFLLQDGSIDGSVKIINGSVTLNKLASSGATKGQFLKYSGTGWTPSFLNEVQTYLGVWDASSGVLPAISNVAGDYWIVSVAGTASGVSYAIGDWIVSDGGQWDKIPYSKNSSVVSFNKRNGLVSLLPADYVYLKDKVTNKVTGSALNDIADLNIATPLDGHLLKYDAASSKWINADITSAINTAIAGKQNTGNYITALTGDISATGPGSVSATVNSIGGSVPDTAATANTLVKRDASTNIAVGTLTTSGITSTGNVNVTGNIVATGNINASGTISGSISTASLTGTLAVNRGGTGLATMTSAALLVGNGTSNVDTILAPLTPGVLVAAGSSQKPSFVNGAGLFVAATTGSTPSFVTGTGLVHSVSGNNPTFVSGTGYLYSTNASAAPSFITGTSSQLLRGDGVATTIYPGAANYVPFVSSIAPITLSQSPLGISGSAVGVGTASPARVFEVASGAANQGVRFSSPTGNFIEFSDGTIIHKIGTEGKLNGTASNDLGIQTSSNAQNIRFNIGSTESMRLNTSGHLLIGTTVSAAPLTVSTTATSGIIASFQSSGAGGGGCTISWNGNACSSDLRLKDHINPIENVLDDVLNLRPVTFNWKKDTSNQQQIGFIAQEIEKYFPQLVSEDSKGLKQVNYANLTSVITQAIKEFFQLWSADSAKIHNELGSIEAENKNLKSRLNKIEKENAELKARLDRIEKSLKAK